MEAVLGTAVEMGAVGCGAAHIGKGCVEQEGWIRGGKAVRDRPNGVCLVELVSKQRERRVFGKEGSWRRADRYMARWVAGSKLFHLAHGNVWCCKKMLVNWLKTVLAQ